MTRALQQLLERGMTPLAQRVEHKALEQLAADFQDWAVVAGHAAELADPKELAPHVVEFLLFRIGEELGRIADMRANQAEFAQRCVHAVTDADRRAHIIDYARELGADKRQLAGDRRAFARWFAEDALTDRFLRRVAAIECGAAFCLRRLGEAAAQALEDTPEERSPWDMWRRLDLEPLLRRVLAYDGDSRVNLEAFRCLTTALRALPPDLQDGAVTTETLQYVFRSALHTRQNVWIQCEALEILQSLSPTSLVTALQTRLAKQRPGDDLFVRRRAVLVAGANFARFPELLDLAPVVAQDPSPYVRQALPKAMRHAPQDKAGNIFWQMALDDPAPEVRAAAIVELKDLLSGLEFFETTVSILCAVFQRENNSFVVRTGLDAAAGGAETLAAQGAQDALESWFRKLAPEIERLHQKAGTLSVRRWAAQARERLWCAWDPEAHALKNAVGKVLRGIPRSRAGHVPRKTLNKAREELFGRVLSVLTQEDFSCDADLDMLGADIVRGDRFGFRWWRALYEFLHPSPDKRQAFKHTIGRLFRGQLRAPSAIMAELSETNVPGEPLFIESEAGWRPYLPLVDEMVASVSGLVAGRSFRIYTAEGVTEIRAPWFPLQCLRAWLTLTLRFAHYAQLRNWREDSAHGAESYIAALGRLGFRIEFTPHRLALGGAPEQRLLEGLEDPSVRRFFPAAVPLFVYDLMPRVRDYFFSVYENTIYELAVFTGGMVLLFFNRILHMSQAMRKARRQFPLVIGGWGTRGKSGTERLKAAMINAYGFGIVSKTTGCEAVFLHAYPFGPLREIILFRPYEKATIWEQHNLVQLAQRIGSQVFLWECMGLTPAYVAILQRQWMRDDIATITNTYPDHEDLQGPAGVNIPDVMCNFIPPSSVLLTSEEQMHPILTEAARDVGAQVGLVDWRDAGLITPDILARFPYEEHSYNIALVLALGEVLGIPPDYALKEMADRVVPDIGMLKAYPVAPIQGRRLEFVNGMSANERFGCLNNWRRMGFQDHDPSREPGVWLCTVVNNRADRVARSRVFADIIVRDLGADQHVLIGTNVRGLRGYIAEAWRDYAAELTLWPENAERDQPDAVARHMAGVLRVPVTGEAIEARLRAMIEGLGGEIDPAQAAALWNRPDELARQFDEAGLGGHAETVERWLARWRKAKDDFEHLLDRIDRASERDAGLDQAFRHLLTEWFHAKIAVVEDHQASGDAVIQRVVDGAPPGLLNRVMGIQNIKGTGQGFIHCWRAWEKCHAYCQQMRSSGTAEIEEGARGLAAFNEYGILCEQYVRETLAILAETPQSHADQMRAEIAVIQSALDTRMKRLNAGLAQAHDAQTGWFDGLLDLAEAFLDAGDAVKRRRTANRIYRDVIHERIGYERAARELQTLQKREKGGWLKTALARQRQRLSAKRNPTRR